MKKWMDIFNDQSYIQMNSMIRCLRMWIISIPPKFAGFPKDSFPPNLSLYKCLFSLFSLYPQIKFKKIKKSLNFLINYVLNFSSKSYNFTFFFFT